MKRESDKAIPESDKAIPAVGASLAEETQCEKPWGENELDVFQGVEKWCQAVG